MTVTSYLNKISNKAIVRASDKDSIDRSINYLAQKLRTDNSITISQQFCFGSHSRGTMLPRSMDYKADVDYIVVFSESNYNPQTYLDRLRRFVSRHYTTSQIGQSNPTIVLNLNHIKFELVPAVRNGFFGGLSIPAKASDYEDWITTDPTSFNLELMNKNKSHGNLIKPLARIIKYWNAQNGHPFESYDLERQIVDYNFYGSGFFGYADLKVYFFEFMSDLSLPWGAAQWKKDKITKLKDTLKAVKSYEALDKIFSAESELKKIMPDPDSPNRGLASTILGF